MELKLAYRGHSGMIADPATRSQTVSLAPNLGREPVAFDAPLLKPLRFREAISTLHDVVISNLRFKKKDKSAYLAWKESQRQLARTTERAEYQRLVEQMNAARAIPVPKDIEKSYHRARKRYWKARQEYSNYLYKNDPELWRMLMPCDPVITVADDVVFFECFSADESSYGCLTVDRDAFGESAHTKLGTTNVDYSWDLYNHFQKLRSYRQTRFRIDPEGFEVATRGKDVQDAGQPYREEKIDLPQSWLRGFMQLQGAMSLPTITVPVAREVVYSILAYLKRHRQEHSPRAVRFELTNGEPPVLVLEPWEIRLVSHSTKYQGPPTDPIRIWGRRRLLALHRLLPLAETFDVHLLATGLPSFWVARMGEMRLTLGLSGWTRNDWTRASAIDLIAPPVKPGPDHVERVGALLHEKRRMSLDDVQASTRFDKNLASAALRHLAHAGQVIHDLTPNVYRWRQIMPQALGEAEIGPEHPELAGAREIVARRPVKLDSREEGPNRSVVLMGKIDGHDVELVIDGDGNAKRGKCACSYYHRFLLRNGPCRHMIALRRLAGQK